MDADRVTFACATAAEQRVARRSGARSALVGLGAQNGLPEGPLVSFGLAGALRDGLAPGTVVDATKVVDIEGTVLWDDGPLGVAGAEPVTILAVDAIVDDPAERRRLHEVTGADAADLESGALVRSGRLQGVLRAVSDTPSRPLEGLAGGVKQNGGYDWAALARVFARSPRGFLRSAVDAQRALGRLGEAAKGWSR
jgi:adenosylhomocysteine nucleosidase